MRRLLAIGETILVGLFAIIAEWPWVKVITAFGVTGKEPGDSADSWLYIYMFQAEIDKLRGVDPTGMFDGGFFFPKQELSLLYTEPTWATTVLLWPLWCWLRNPFQVVYLASLIFMLAGWMATFRFARTLGATRGAALFAAAALGLSAAYLGLMARPFFWPFWIVPAAGSALVHLMRGPSWSRATWFGFLFALLAWSSGHLTVMGGAFLLVLFLWLDRAHPAWRAQWRTVALGGGLALVGALTAFVPQVLAFRDVGFHRGLDMQANSAANLWSLIGCRWSHLAAWILGKAGVASGDAETIPGLPPLSIIVATLGLIFACTRRPEQLAAARRAAPRRRRAILAAALVGAVLLAWLLLPTRIDDVALGWNLACGVWGILAVSLVALWPRLRAAAREPEPIFFAIGLVTLAATLGPLLTLNPPATASPLLPLLRAPGFSAIRATSRWSIVAAFAFGLAAAGALMRLPLRWRAIGAWCALALLIADCLTPEHFSPTLPAVDQTHWAPRPVDEFLKAVPGPGAVIELPIQLDNPGAEMRWIYSRTYHHRPTVNGWAGLTPRFIEQWCDLAEDSLARRGRLTPEGIAKLRHLGARFWIIHIDQLPRYDAAEWPATLGELKRLAASPDGQLLIYEDPEPKSSI